MTILLTVIVLSDQITVAQRLSGNDLKQLMTVTFARLVVGVQICST